MATGVNGRRGVYARKHVDKEQETEQESVGAPSRQMGEKYAQVVGKKLNHACLQDAQVHIIHIQKLGTFLSRLLLN